MSKSKKVAYLQRWMFIIDKINSHPYITLEELKTAVEEELVHYDGIVEVGTKNRTLERDLFEIRNSPYMDISIIYCRTRRGYYIPQDEKSISKLDRLFEMSSLFSFSSLKGIVFTEERKSRGLEHRFRLINAIRKSVEIEIEYDKYTQPDKGRLRRLRPYALREFKNRWYLLAMEANAPYTEKNMLKIWGLDRIRQLTLTARKFEKDPDLDIKTVFEYCFGICANRDMLAERVVLSFDPLNGRYIESCPLHETQKVLVDDDTELRIELTVKITQDFMMELLSLSEGMRVVEPDHLRERLIEIHKKAIDSLGELTP